MKIHLFPRLLFFSVLLAAGLNGHAQTAATPPDAPRELTIVVVEPLGLRSDRHNDFDRLDIGFTKVFAKRKWPVRIKVERFAANQPEHDIELRLVYEGIHPETFADLTFKAWTTLTDHGVKHDFGIVRYRSDPRIGQDREDALDEAVRGAANVIADKIEPILFPKAAPVKP
jgi:hypothetical protein